ncbi:MAG TPA: flagellar hook-basal body complex protein FliE [Pyrinomonadaceae bacterium]|nr:flagellar hook-basal body complex protein FliE [Pyrinomonadaceae bacterium]
MPVLNINSLNSISPLTSTNGTQKATSDGFGSLIKDAVESIDSTQKGAEQEISKAVTGESPDLHKTIIALQTADLKFQLGLQVRNKLLGAYDEIMRMQV